jgi:hypothetical protein
VTGSHPAQAGQSGGETWLYYAPNASKDALAYVTKQTSNKLTVNPTSLTALMSKRMSPTFLPIHPGAATSSSEQSRRSEADCRCGDGSSGTAAQLVTSNPKVYRKAERHMFKRAAPSNLLGCHQSDMVHFMQIKKIWFNA